MVESEPQKSVLLELTDAAREEVRALIGDARHGALAVLDPKDGHPISSRVGVATLADGTPLILISALAAHTPALLNDPRCSLLIGEPGRGDPLAHPRITLRCRAAEVIGEAERNEARKRYLSAHPKAALYIDLPDFRFFRLEIESASFNGGFGRAYALTRGDLVSYGTTS